MNSNDSNSILLRLKNLSYSYGSDLVLEDVSFEIRERCVTGLTGPNGGGKSTLFDILLGLLQIQQGSIEWTRPVELGAVSQQLLPKKGWPLTVKNFVEVGKWGPKKNSAPALSIAEAMEALDLGPIADHLISDLSGGQWKRALIARGLVQPADLYLLDEPFNFLDVEMEDRVGHLLRKLVNEKGKTFFVISHDWNAMDHHFDRLLLLKRRLIASGSVREVSEIAIDWKDPAHHRWMHH